MCVTSTRIATQSVHRDSTLMTISHMSYYILLLQLNNNMERNSSNTFSLQSNMISKTAIIALPWNIHHKFQQKTVS